MCSLQTSHIAANIPIVTLTYATQNDVNVPTASTVSK